MMMNTLKKNTELPPNNLKAGRDPWALLKEYTDARIGLGRRGVGQPLVCNLDFKLAHAQARDAVQTKMETVSLLEDLSKLETVIALQSAAADRETYLTRPDLGRKLSGESIRKLIGLVGDKSFDIAIVIGDGLSSRAIHENVVGYLDRLVQEIRSSGYSLAPLSIVENARVAVGDEVAELCHAKMVIVLIGERPGLSSPDSMGIYLTYGAKVGCTDEKRNCISNVRKAGYPISEAVRKTCYLMENAMQKGLSGVNLKDNMDSLYLSFVNRA